MSRLSRTGEWRLREQAYIGKQKRSALAFLTPVWLLTALLVFWGSFEFGRKLAGVIAWLM